VPPGAGEKKPAPENDRGDICPPSKRVVEKRKRRRSQQQQRMIRKDCCANPKSLWTPSEAISGEFAKKGYREKEEGVTVPIEG